MNKIKEHIINQFTQQVGYVPNINNPKSFNEKIQWLKLYYRDPLMTQCADKYAVREYIKEKIGENYLIPLLGVYDNANEIDFNKLPNKFVLKTNWGSGQNIIVKDKTKINEKELIDKLNNWLKPENSHYLYSYEWVYKDIKPKIICEKYIGKINLIDYKFHCFNGEIKIILTCSNRNKILKKNFYDINWKLLPVKRISPNSSKKIPKPKYYNRMLEIVKILSKDFPFVRVDLYEVENKIFFGELTFYPGNGMEKFEPIEWDYKIGEYLKLQYNPNIFSNTSNLKNELISKEIKYGGIITNIPRNKVSPHDPRTKEQITTGGMTGGDRMLHHKYAKYYSKYLFPYLKQKMTLVEIGILKGSGLAIWCDIFPKANVIGFDIDLDHVRKNLLNLKKLGAFKKNNPKLFEFDQFKNNKKLLNKLFYNNKINICIDDGYHSNEANINTLKQILPFLSPNFIYFIEDNVGVHKKLKKIYPQYKVENFKELTIITNPEQEIFNYLEYKKIRKAKTVVYTAFTDNYDNLIQHKYISKDIDYICFTDKKIKNPGIWEIKPIKDNLLDPNRKAKEYKIFPNKFLQEYQYSVWIDANIDINSDYLEKTIKKITNKKNSIAVNPHFERDCIYQDAKECISLQKDNPEIILKQVEYLKKQNYPKNNGLFENNIIFREHNNPKIIKLMEDWWWMIENFSYRDQLSFNYVLWKNKTKCDKLFSQNARFMKDDFTLREHNTKIVSTLFVDNGNDFYNDDFIQKIVIISANQYKSIFDLSEFKKIKQIKLNILKNRFCQFKISKLKIDGKTIFLSKMKYETNGTLLDNGYIDFSKTLDPQIIININKKINKLKIIGNINFYNTENLYIDSTNQINTLVHEKEQIKLDSTNQINTLVQEKENIQKENKKLRLDLNKIQSSKTYKLWQKYNLALKKLKLKLNN